MKDRVHFRERVYRSYVSAGESSLAPKTVDGLSGRARYMRRLIRTHFPKDKSAAIYEIGCGHGALLHFARESGYHNVRGVDGSCEQVAAARRLGVEGVSHGDAAAAISEIADSSLDAVIAFDVIEHFTRDEAMLLIDDVFRVLKRGGRFIMHVPNGESPFFGRVRYGDLTHEFAYTRTSLTQLLASSGFGAVSCHEDRPVAGSLTGYVRLILWKVIRGVLRLYLAVETGDSGREAIFSQNLLCVATKHSMGQR